MEKRKKILKAILLVAGLMLGFAGLSAIVDVRGSVSSAGVIILTSTEASELTAVYGGVFLVLSALCFFSRSRLDDKELVNFVAFAFLVVALVRLYAILRYGWPESGRIYFSLVSELFFGLSIYLLNRKFNTLGEKTGK